MPSLIDLRRRLRAVKSTEQITKAMKAISASKLRKAQDRMVGARPFAQLMQRVLGDLALQVDSTAHPLLSEPVSPSTPKLLVVVTADKGLCGGFNSTLIRKATSVIKETDSHVVMGLVGRRGRDYFVRRDADVCFEEVNIFNDLQYSHAQAMARIAIEQYSSGEVSGVSVIYNEFKSVMQQQVVVESLLPIPKTAVEDEDGAPDADYLFEPDASEIFDDLLPRYIETQFFRALLESAAAEHAARMTAMDSASRNAGEMIDSLTLHMNKVRQAAITRELIEVVSGADAL
jgi:F-type H+-transporting ATPase subunit gamma